ncbi:MAG: hypothetical protein R8M45_11935 [Ghiorsea sp.]
MMPLDTFECILLGILLVLVVLAGALVRYVSSPKVITLSETDSAMIRRLLKRGYE